LPFSAERLRGIREAKNLTQEQLQVLTGIHHSRIARYERGKGVPTVENLDRLSVALDVTTDYLLSRGFDGIPFTIAATEMALKVFEDHSGFTNDDHVRCRRVVDHPDAPRTSAGWKSLAEMMKLGLGPLDGQGATDRSKLRVIPKG
jgi:transcriptional regulator with XRE-family HTH domain